MDIRDFAQYKEYYQGFTCIIIDEAWRAFSINKEREIAHASPNILPTLMSQSLKFKLSFIIASQLPSKLMESMLGLCSIKVCFTLDNAKDAECMAKSMGLTAEQKKLLTMLPPGQAVIKLTPRQWSTSFPVQFKFHDFNNEASMTNEEVISTTKDRLILLGISFVPRKKEQPEVNEKTKVVEAELTDIEKKFIIIVLQNPLRPITKHYTAIGLSTGTGSSLTKKLIKSKMIILADFSRKKQGGAIKLVNIQKKAFDVLTLNLPSFYPGEGDFLHRVFQNKIAETWRKKGCMTELSFLVNGKKADVCCFTGNEMIDIEVGYTVEREDENIINGVRSFSEVIEFVRTKKMRDQIDTKIKKVLSKEELSRVSFRYLSELIE